MRLIYRQGPNGRLCPVIGSPPAVPAWRSRAPARTALIVHPDPAERRRLHAGLLAEGFDPVISCAGPRDRRCGGPADAQVLPCLATVAPWVYRIVVAEAYRRLAEARLAAQQAADRRVEFVLACEPRASRPLNANRTTGRPRPSPAAARRSAPVR